MADIDDVIRQDQRRGKRRRPIDIETQRRHNKLLAAVRRCLREHDEETFKEIIAGELGLTPGSPEYVEALRLWRAAASQKP